MYLTKSIMKLIYFLINRKIKFFYSFMKKHVFLYIYIYKDQKINMNSYSLLIKILNIL